MTSVRGKYSVAVLSPVVGGHYFGKVLAGVSRAARAGGHRVVVVQTYPADLERAQFPEEPPVGVPVGLDAADGLIVVTTAVDAETVERLGAEDRPMVLVGEHSPVAKAPAVAPDNAGGTRAAVEHLIAHGHVEIGFVGSLRQSDIVERYEAYRATLRDHGIEPRDEWVYHASDNQEAAGAAAARQALTAGMPTTATFVATDRNAAGFTRMLQVSGLALPKRQAVVGFDHSDLGARMRPRLATVDPHHDGVGELAVSLLVAQIRGERPRGRHLSAASLITRESCGCREASVGPVQGTGEEAATSWARLAGVAEIVLDGAGAAPGIEAWMRSVQRIVRGADALAVLPDADALASLVDITRALRPHPEALEQLVPALRSVEEELAKARKGRTRAPGEPGPTARRRAVARAITDVIVALSTGCTQTLLARAGRLERTIGEQYELDLGLLHADAPTIRTLRWLPKGHRGPATLALWSDAAERLTHPPVPDDVPRPGLRDYAGEIDSPAPRPPAGTAADPARELTVVGTTATSAQARALVGTRLPVASFPTRALLDSADGIAFVIPVTFDTSDWGLLLIGGAIDTHTTSARDKFDHWAAMLAVALDREARLVSLRTQRAALADMAARERALALDLRAGQVRYRLVEEVALEGTWDWDITTGHVYYSRTWKSLLGLADDEVGSGIEEWTSRVHPDDQRAVRSAIARQLAGACVPLDLEHRLTAADGRELWVRARATTVTDDAGVRARMVGVLMVLGAEGSGDAAPWRTSRVRPQADASPFSTSQ
ncbi:substrate-binding domain-containing protein [Myceligenerans salitolerans]|uniref:Substrate-binding domain-containing protein n=1 Tax=Myceligenerans salitolerans TaxID=1230528 RepID=A0ABS3I9J0_9MICO|nr:substrate-binding domain-containing protein [Myceligenerans salitolerans]MBO0609696.1 substrate-binding domain-containing protein [Myceligenerans salitolerans]